MVGIVQATAGSGKTTLLSHVASRSEWPVAWLTLDGGCAELLRLEELAAGDIEITSMNARNNRN